ncbi:Ras association domain-containing protein 10, partial [Ophiophagus hannah]
MLSGLPQSYCIVEKWRGFERILPNKTKILRLWAAWGDEQENVRFVLVRSEASLPNTGPRSAEARVVPSRDSPGRHGLGVTARASLALSQERQRRVDHTIRQQIKRLRDLDREIDRYEARIHFDRMKRHGVNYVQDTYLEEEEEETAVADEDLPFNPGDELPSSVPITSGDWGEEAARSLSKDREDREDEDSDTGLSSMHSQDSDSVPVCESLV